MCVIHEFKNPILVHTELGTGYVLYIKSNGMYCDDEACVIMQDDGRWLFFSTKQLKAHHNGAYEIAMDLARKNANKNEPK